MYGTPLGFTLRAAAGSRHFHPFPFARYSFRRHKLCKFLQLRKDNRATSTGTWCLSVLCNRICGWWRRVSPARKTKVHLAVRKCPETKSALSFLKSLEVVVDPWLDGLWKAIKEALSKMSSDSNGCMKGEVEDSQKETAESCLLDVQLNLLRITDQNDSPQKSRGMVPTTPASPSDSSVQPAVSDLGVVPSTTSPESTSLPSDAASALTSVTVPQEYQAERSCTTPVASLTHSLPPLSESSLNVPTLPSPYLEVSLQQTEMTEEVNLRWIEWMIKSACALF